LKGRRLTRIPAYTAYWFAWSSFWPGTEVYGDFAQEPNQLEPMIQTAVPTSQIFADVAADAIPPLDDPQLDVGRAEFVEASAARLSDDEIVIGVEIDGDARAYPVRILNWHEIVNHTVGGRKISLTYCPLTASGINFDASKIAFGNSGALFNNNMVMYNRDGYVQSRDAEPLVTDANLRNHRRRCRKPYRPVVGSSGKLGCVENDVSRHEGAGRLNRVCEDLHG
jgi:hypothetical protein